MDKARRIVEGFAQELVRYKELLHEVRTGLGILLKNMPGPKKITVYQFYEKLPYIYRPNKYKLLPPPETHNLIIRLFREKDAGQEFTRQIDELESLYDSHVSQEMERRKHISKPRVNIDNQTTRLLQKQTGNTHLTKFILARMRESRFSLGELVRSATLSNYTFEEVFARLDDPSKYNSSRALLDRVLNFPPFGFKPREKEICFELFNVNCWASASEGKDLKGYDCIEAYKLTLRVLIMQAGVSTVKLAEMFGGISSEYASQMLNPTGKYYHVLPTPEHHRNFCQELREMQQANLTSFDDEDVANLCKAHEAAHNEYKRLNNNRGKISTEKLSPLAVRIVEIIQARKVAGHDICKALGLGESALSRVLKMKKQTQARKAAELLMRKSTDVIDHKDQTPSYQPGADGGLVKLNYVPKGVEYKGRNYVLGFSGLPYEEQESLRKLVAESKTRG